MIYVCISALMFCQEALRLWGPKGLPGIVWRPKCPYPWPSGPAGERVRLFCSSPGATWTPKVPQTAALAMSKCNLDAKSVKTVKFAVSKGTFDDKSARNVKMALSK